MTRCLAVCVSLIASVLIQCGPSMGDDVIDLGARPTAQCRAASDCRLFSNYCQGCTCVALPAKAPDPGCNGPTVSCFRDPCQGLQADCKSGVCTTK